jgi:DNA-binding transcriptional ArsR family regulator
LRTDEPYPLIHVPARLKIVATLAALPDGDALSFTRLQDMIGLTPGNLLIHLRKLEDAGYLISEKSGNGAASRTTLTAITQTAAWVIIFFFAPAGASSAYLTVSEIFPMETRAMAIAFSYAIGTAAGASPGQCCSAS